MLKNFIKWSELTTQQRMSSGIYIQLFSNNSVYVGKSEQVYYRYLSHLNHWFRCSNKHKLSPHLKYVDGVLLEVDIVSTLENPYVMLSDDDLDTLEAKTIIDCYEAGYKILNKFKNNNKSTLDKAWCPTCQKVFKRIELRKLANNGLRCVDCDRKKLRENMRKHRSKQVNIDKIRAYKKSWTQKNIEHHRKYQREWAQNKRDMLKSKI